jgi:hypothetical protein
MALVRRTHITGTFATLPVPADTPLREVAATLGALRRAAAEAGMVLHHQPRTPAAVLAAGRISFYGEARDE